MDEVCRYQACQDRFDESSRARFVKSAGRLNSRPLLRRAKAHRGRETEREREGGTVV